MGFHKANSISTVVVFEIEYMLFFSFCSGIFFNDLSSYDDMTGRLNVMFFLQITRLHQLVLPEGVDIFLRDIWWGFGRDTCTLFHPSVNEDDDAISHP